MEGKQLSRRQQAMVASPARPRFKALFTRLAGGGQAVRVSPGDDLWPAVEGREEKPTARQLADHWAVRSIVGQIARGLGGVHAHTAVETQDGFHAIADQRGRDILRPHIKRIALDVERFGCFVAVIAADKRGTPRELVPLPADEVELEIEGGALKLVKLGSEEWTADKVFIVAEELPAGSPLEALRGILEEDIAASDWRRDAWKSSPRGLVLRDLEAPDWTNKARERFQESFGARMRGASRGGRTGVALLEDGMKWEDTPLPDASSAQFIEARRLTAEIVADVYGVQGSLLATGADKQIGPARRQLIAGPVADVGRLISIAFAAQLAVPMYGEANGPRITVVFDIAEAMWREDEEANRTSSAVGRPWRTPNEQRELEGREPVDGGDELGSAPAKTVVTQ